MEAAVCNLVEEGNEVIVGANGFFAERMVEMVERWGGKPIRIKKRWGDIVTKEEVEDAFSKSNANLVSLIHAETSTGALQPLEDIAKVCRSNDALLMADAVTSFTGVELEIDKWGVDVCYSSPQKCLNCPPGASPITINDKALNRIRNRKKHVSSLYFDFTLIERYWNERRMYHHTAPIANVYALREAIIIALEEGIDARIIKHRRNSEALVAGLEAAGLTMNTEKEFTLPSLNAVRVPEGTSDIKVKQRLLDLFNMEVGAGLGELTGQVWRVGLMGINSNERNVLFFLQALEVASKLEGFSMKKGAAIDAALDYYQSH
jgi:alanine-glyoxylate transaminase/serine-glyoxylate transaminase/serine-pyruvate transaminase